MHATRDLWKTLRCWPPAYTPNLNTIGQAVPEIQKDTEMRCARVHALQLMEPQLHTKFQHNRPSCYRVVADEAFMEKGLRTCARADAPHPRPWVKHLGNDPKPTHLI